MRPYIIITVNTRFLIIVALILAVCLGLKYAYSCGETAGITTAFAYFEKAMGKKNGPLDQLQY